MKNVLLLVHDDPGQEARLQAALDLTRALGGHLICLDVAVPPFLMGDPYGMPIEGQLVEEERAHQAQNRATLQARLAREDVPWTWVDAGGGFADALNRAAGSADLVVVNRQLDSFAPFDMRTVAGDVVVSSGRAVVAVPEKSRAFAAAGKAIVAWDGSEEAMNALHSAVPLLRLASSVEILEVDDGSLRVSAEEAASYLSRHGVSARIVRRDAKGRATSNVIVAEAGAHDADYVVMGGYGHSRLFEALFGGVSREMLGGSPVPVIMTH